MKILVTGGSGFIGTHLCKSLVKESYQVRNLDLVQPRKWIPGVEYFPGDVRNPLCLAAALRDVQAVFHFAAMVSVPLCQERPVESYETNLISTLKILHFIEKESERQGKKLRFIFSGSSVVYGHLGNSGQALKETLPLEQPLSFYGSQKLASEHAIQVFYRLKKIPSVIFRFFNVYGSGQDPHSPYSGVISVFSAAAKEGRPLFLHGEGKQTRDFISVKDVVNACLSTLKIPEEDCDAKPINLGSGSAISISDLAHQIVLIGKKKAPILEALAREGDVFHSKADISRAKKILKWEPIIDFQTGLRELF